MSGLVDAIFNGIINGLVFAVSNILSPVDTLIGTLIPNSTTVVSYVYNFSNYICSLISFPLTFLPTSFVNILIMVIDIEIAFLIGSVLYLTITFVFKLLKNAKFW